MLAYDLESDGKTIESVRLLRVESERLDFWSIYEATKRKERPQPSKEERAAEWLTTLLASSNDGSLPGTFVRHEFEMAKDELGCSWSTVTNANRAHDIAVIVQIDAEGNPATGPGTHSMWTLHDEHPLHPNNQAQG